MSITAQVTLQLPAAKAGANLAHLDQFADGTRVMIGCSVASIRPTVTKNGRSAGKKMAMLTLEDLFGKSDAVVFSETYEKIGLLLAPASGEKTRRRIGETARRMGSDARHTVEQARETVTDAATGLGADVKSAIDAGREAFRHDGEGRPASRIAQIVNPPSTTHTP